MSARKQCDQRPLDHGFLSEDHGASGLLSLLHLLRSGLETRDDRIVSLMIVLM